jgi:hypothetical protein
MIVCTVSFRELCYYRSSTIHSTYDTPRYCRIMYCISTSSEYGVLQYLVPSITNHKYSTACNCTCAIIPFVTRNVNADRLTLTVTTMQVRTMFPTSVLIAVQYCSTIPCSLLFPRPPAYSNEFTGKSFPCVMRPCQKTRSAFYHIRSHTQSILSHFYSS